MAASPEIPMPEIPQVQERQEEFIVPEVLQNSGVQVVQKNFKSQVKNDNGLPVIQTPPAQVITTVEPPYNDEVLIKQSKGSINLSSTWYARFWMRVVERAKYFGWKIVGKGQNVQ